MPLPATRTHWVKGRDRRKGLMTEARWESWVNLLLCGQELALQSVFAVRCSEASRPNMVAVGSYPIALDQGEYQADI